MHDPDFSQRFLFDDYDVRGELVALDASYQHVLAKHPYPEPVAQLLGEMLAAGALLIGTLKFDGLLVLQARSSGSVPLLMVECSSAGEVRGIARYHAEQIGSGDGMRRAARSRAGFSKLDARYVGDDAARLAAADTGTERGTENELGI